MAKLYFYYAAMNAGKSTMLLQTKHNYEERGMRVLMFMPQIGERGKKGTIISRIGVEAPAITFSADFDFLAYTKNASQEGEKPVSALLVDEAHFLKKQQVKALTQIVNNLGIPVLAYGLRSDFLGELFEGSHYLLAWAENIKELKNICHCGRKATMNMRVDENGRKCKEGPQVEVGGNERYIATCMKHFQEGMALPFLK